jgi:putative holliday junction resolvase
LKILALDYGLARTGVAVSDPTGTVARPLGVVERAATKDGLARVVDLAKAHDAEAIVVGMPLTLGGQSGEQATETERFVEALRAAADVPVETFDERFTTRMAQASQAQGAGSDENALAAAHLLTTYLEWLTTRAT